MPTSKLCLTGPDRRAAFLYRSVLAFAAVGITASVSLADNGGCYRSGVFREAPMELGSGRRNIRPRHPHTNGKAEGFRRRETKVIPAGRAG